jgi:hypothetical protein
MPIFHLKPIVGNLEHHAWDTSLFRGECWVNAESEAEARGLASGEYQNGGATIPGISERPSPWYDPALVEIGEVPEGPSGMRIPKHTVVAG